MKELGFENTAILQSNLVVFEFDELCLRIEFTMVINFNKRVARRERLKSALYLRLKERKVCKAVKRGPYGLFANPACCKISKKMQGDPLETLFLKIFENEK